MHIPLQTILLFHYTFVFLLRYHPMTKPGSNYNGVRICTYATSLLLSSGDLLYIRVNICTLILLGYLEPCITLIFVKTTIMAR